jgi:hypothetical protein
MADVPKSYADLQTAFANNSTRKITAVELRQFLTSVMNVHGGLVGNYSGAAIPLVAATYVKLNTIFTDVMPSHGVVANSTVGTIVVPVTGTYEAFAQFSGSMDANGRTVHTAFFVDNVVRNLEAERKYQNANDVGSHSMYGLLDINANSTVDIRADIDANASYSPNHTQFFLKFVG